MTLLESLSPSLLIFGALMVIVLTGTTLAGLSDRLENRRRRR